MKIGFFDLPSGLFDRVQHFFDGFLPPIISILFWALLAAFLSMKFYAWCSDQQALKQLKPLQKQARERLATYDGPFDGLLPLVRENLAMSLKHMRLTLLPALFGSLPLLFLLPWLSNTYSLSFPSAGTAITVKAEGIDITNLYWSTQAAVKELKPGDWELTWPESGADVELMLGDDASLLTIPLTAPSPVVHKKQWWNNLFANPAGYIAADSPIQAVFLELPPQQFLPIGPSWLRGWLSVFLAGLIVFSLLFKWFWRLR